MAIGPLGRIIAQFVVVAGSSIGRAVIQKRYRAVPDYSSVQAYRDAAKRGTLNASGGPGQRQPLSLRPRMSTDEARRILGLEGSASPSATPLCREEIEARHKRLYEINAPSVRFAGSPYLQKKVNVAKIVLLESLADEQRASATLKGNEKCENK
ncbi:mitochondria-associated granulocyte macrophage csf signaling [Cystoisospora suis]|uniref:Mitochondria-associated granulocyte macrophage csf signaling n=1 Tax=Cystoisospora suis TaxID=483139 RepID=A0A2C6KPW4_9APIC|nr:mitochondria-associated granulocyte macrophage csf signaling [Cystoisospora suis]